MSCKVHFIKTEGSKGSSGQVQSKTDSNGSSSILGSSSKIGRKFPRDPTWLKYAKKELLIQFITKRKWTSRSVSELQKYSTQELREKTYDCLKRYGTIQDVQSLEEFIMKDKAAKDEKRSDKLQENKKRKESILAFGCKYFVPGAKVWLFDEKPVDKYGRVIKKMYPIQVKVIEQKNEGKIVLVEFQETRQWYESGGHWVHKGQQMTFKFDPVTCVWLREGLTPEVVRSYGPNGKSIYFELSFTRQYLLMPMERQPT
jgi:hypothetical protein